MARFFTIIGLDDNQNIFPLAFKIGKGEIE